MPEQCSRYEPDEHQDDDERNRERKLPCGRLRQPNEMDAEDADVIGLSREDCTEKIEDMHDDRGAAFGP